MRAQARALKEENEQSFIILSGNTQAFLDTLDQEMREFFNSLDKKFKNDRVYKPVVKKLRKKLQEVTDGDFTEALEILEFLYLEVEEL